MSSTPKSFSRNVFTVICKFLPEKSIAELRQVLTILLNKIITPLQVCKSEKEIVCSFVTTQRTKINCFSLSEMASTIRIFFNGVTEFEF